MISQNSNTTPSTHPFAIRSATTGSNARTLTSHVFWSARFLPRSRQQLRNRSCNESKVQKYHHFEAVVSPGILEQNTGNWCKICKKQTRTSMNIWWKYDLCVCIVRPPSNQLDCIERHLPKGHVLKEASEFNPRAAHVGHFCLLNPSEPWVRSGGQSFSWKPAVIHVAHRRPLATYKYNGIDECETCEPVAKKWCAMNFPATWCMDSTLAALFWAWRCDLHGTNCHAGRSCFNELV